MIASLEENEYLRGRVANMSLARVRTFNVPLSSGYEATVKVIIPPEITFHSYASYPLIVQV